MYFPRPFSNQKVKLKRVYKFGGCNFTPSCEEWELESGNNLSSRRYPALCPRERKYFLQTECSDFFIYDRCLYTVSNKKLMKDGVAVLSLIEPDTVEREFSVVGNKLCVFPDRKYYNIENGEGGNLYTALMGTCSFGDGTRFSVSAENNTLTCESVNFQSAFSVGDGIRISGSLENDGYYVVREIDGNKLVFDENVFTKESGTEGVMISREIPKLKYTFECNNRLWGVLGNSIYASALGDPFNFYVFDGISTDSYYKEIFSSGKFTGGIRYGNTPVFFKENMIYRVFGDIPMGFYLEMREAPGVTDGCHRSLANVNGVLMYAGTDGIYGYSSSYPVKLSSKLGALMPGMAAAGSDGIKYYISVSDFSGIYGDTTNLLNALENKKTYIYDSISKIWHKVDNPTPIVRIQSGIYGSSKDKSNVFALDKSGKIFTVCDNIAGTVSDFYYETDYETVESQGIGGVWQLEGFSRLRFVTLCLAVSEGAEFGLDISFGGEDFTHIGTVKGDGKGERKSHTFKIPQNRCSSFRLRYRGMGDFTLYSVEVGYVSSGHYEK